MPRSVQICHANSTKFCTMDDAPQRVASRQVLGAPGACVVMPTGWTRFQVLYRLKVRTVYALASPAPRAPWPPRDAMHEQRGSCSCSARSDSLHSARILSAMQSSAATVSTFSLLALSFLCLHSLLPATVVTAMATGIVSKNVLGTPLKVRTHAQRSPRRCDSTASVEAACQ